MATIDELVYYGFEGEDNTLIRELGNRLGVPCRGVRLPGLYGLPQRLPRWLCNQYIRRIVHLLSPWYDALRIACLASSNQLVLIRPHRTAIAYLLLFDPLKRHKPKVVVTWCALSTRPPARTRRVYHLTLTKARGIFIYTPKEQLLYSSDFGISPAILHLMPLCSHPIDPKILDELPEDRFDVVMTGSSGRDWNMFIALCRAMPDLRFAAVAPVDQIRAMGDCLNLTKFEPLGFAAYCRLINASKVSLLLLKDLYGATGQRDLLTIGRLGRPLVANRVESLVSYAGLDETVRFVHSGDLAATCVAIRDVLMQPALRQSMGRALQQHVLEHHCVASVARRWAEVLAPMLRDS